MRPLRAWLATAVVLLALAPAVASAQDAPTTTPESAPATTAPAATTTTTPETCTDPLPVATQFVGQATSVGDVTVTFGVGEYRAGDVAGSVVEVDFPDDARFVKIDEVYLVTAATDPESGRLQSKVRLPHGEAEVCQVNDAIYTRLRDGKAIDTAIFSGMRGKWTEVAVAVLVPLGAAVAVLILLVLIKRGVVSIFHALSDARARRRFRRLHQPDPAPRVPARQ